jgi:membrane associated rhomboid family serine protease
MGICTLIFITMQCVPDLIGYQLIHMFGMVPVRYSDPTWAQNFGLPKDYGFSFISNLFLHSDWLHLLANLIFLYIFGDNVEDRMGHWRFLIYYLFCGAIATILQWYFVQDLPIPVVGASGAIAGILAAYYFMYPLEKVILWFPFLVPILIPVPAIAFLGIWVMMQLHNATEAAFFTHHTAGVAWWAHLGGFIAGCVCYRWFLRPGSTLTSAKPDSLN